VKIKRILLLVVVAAVPLCFSTYYPPFSNTLRNITVGAAKPVFDLSHFLSSNVSGGLSNIRDYFRVYTDNVFLRSTLGGLRQKLVRSEELEKENERLRALLDFKASVRRKAIPVEIISRDISHWSDWVVLGSGNKEGIRVDMPLLSPLGLAGRVIFCDDRYSRAMLITDVKSRLSAMAQRTRDLGIVRGDGRGLLVMDYLPLDCEAKVGDVVITSGLGGIYPKGLAVGSIESISKDRGALTLSALVRPFADLDRLEEVLCLESIQEG